MVARPALILLLALAGAAAQTAPAAEDCSRAGIVKAISAIPSTKQVVSIITQLNLTSFLPDKAGNGTLFLPKDAAFASLGIPTQQLVTTFKNQTIAIIAYHSLLGQKQTLSRNQLVSSSPIKSDLSIIQAALGDKGDYALTFQPGPGHTPGREQVKGIRNLSTIRGVVKYCGYYVYPIDGVLIPGNSLQQVPAGAGAAFGSAMASGANLNTPGGLASAIGDKTLALPPAAIAAGKAADAKRPPSSPASNGPLGAALTAGGNAAGPAAGPSSGAGGVGGIEGGVVAPAQAPGAAGAPRGAMSGIDGVAGAVLPLNGTGGTLSSMEPVMLQGNVTSGDGKKMLGPGLVYLDGAVQDGQGVDGTATAVSTFDGKGATLTERSIPLKGAKVDGLPFSAAGIKILPAAAVAPGAMGPEAMSPNAMSPAGAPGAAMSPGAMGPGASSSAGGAAGTFGKPLPGSKDGNLNSKGPIILDGTVKGGKALNAAKASGDAAKGSLGPGGIFVNGVVKDGKGVSGRAYPIVSLSSKAIALNADNGVDIKGADLSGTGYSAEGIKPKLQGANAPGGPGAASAGSPGVSKPGQPSDTAAAPAPGTAPGASSATAAVASFLVVLSTTAVVCLAIA